MTVLEHETRYMSTLCDVKVSHFSDSFEQKHLIIFIELHVSIEQDCLWEQVLLFGDSSFGETELLETLNHVAVEDTVCLEISDVALLG